MEPPAYFPLLCKKALRAALSLHKKQPEAQLACSRHVKRPPASPQPRTEFLRRASPVPPGYPSERVLVPAGACTA